MREIGSDIFRYAVNFGVDALCIPTNGAVNRGGLAVMGAGLARVAVALWPSIRKCTGDYLRRHGHNVGVLSTVWAIGDKTVIERPADRRLGMPLYDLVSFPSKPKICPTINGLLPKFKNNARALEDKGPFPGWMSRADSVLITTSARKLVQLADKKGWTNVVLPKVGCGNGGLDWEFVGPKLTSILDDRFSIVDISWQVVTSRLVSVDTGIVRIGSSVTVVSSLRPGAEHEAKILACYDRNMLPCSALDLSNLRKNETLRVAMDGDVSLLNIGPAFKRANRDYVVELLET